MFDPALDDREFVTPQARHEIHLAHAATQPFGNSLQQLVTDKMPVRIVDLLELIEVEEQHGKLLASIDQRERLIEPFIESRSVEQAGQRIVMRQVRNL